MKRTAVGLAAVAALGVAVVMPSVGQSQAPRTITLESHTQSVRVVDLPPRGKSSAGDLVMAISSLQNADGTRAGREYLTCNLTGRARTFESARYNCTGTHKLQRRDDHVRRHHPAGRPPGHRGGDRRHGRL